MLGRMTYARLSDIPEPIDMVDIFRASSAVPGVVAEALALKPLPKVIWMQLGVRNDEAAARAEAVTSFRSPGCGIWAAARPPSCSSATPPMIRPTPRSRSFEPLWRR